MCSSLAVVLSSSPLSVYRSVPEPRLSLSPLPFGPGLFLSLSLTHRVQGSVEEAEEGCQANGEPDRQSHGLRQLSPSAFRTAGAFTIQVLPQDQLTPSSCPTPFVCIHGKNSLYHVCHVRSSQNVEPYN